MQRNVMQSHCVNNNCTCTHQSNQMVKQQSPGRTWGEERSNGHVCVCAQGGGGAQSTKRHANSSLHPCRLQFKGRRPEEVGQIGIRDRFDGEKQQYKHLESVHGGENPRHHQPEIRFPPGTPKFIVSTRATARIKKRGDHTSSTRDTTPGICLLGCLVDDNYQ